LSCSRAKRRLKWPQRAINTAIWHAGSFLNIPQQLLLEASLATSPDYNLQPAFAALLLLDGAEEIDERTLLVLTLLLERAKGAASKWAPYIAILPRTYSEHNFSICVS